MDTRIPLEAFNPASPTSAVAGVFIAIYTVHLALVYFDVPVLSLKELLWNTAVYCIPTPLLLDAARRRELRANSMLSQTHAAKSEALRRLVGLSGTAILQKLPAASEALVGTPGHRRWSSVLGTGSAAVTSEVPAGLGNWDNSCYQNSVLQALAALTPLRTWLRGGGAQSRTGGHAAAAAAAAETSTTTQALQETIAKLRDPTNNGKHLWTPAKLKSMSSWQQQDAQEYFSKVMDELDKEAAKAITSQMAKPGLETAADLGEPKAEAEAKRHVSFDTCEAADLRNPLEGLIAQRVACTSCGFSEGYSMIPFNCLTVPLGSSFQYDLAQCLDEYTRKEDIEGVECRKCTLLRAEDKIKAMTNPRTLESDSPGSNPQDAALSLPPEIRAQIAQRLAAIRDALAEDDYSDKTLKSACQIPAKGYVSSTKTREALVGRAPQTLVIHVNRSVFDEMTGMQRKNYAHVRYPLTLDLHPWMLGIGDTAANYRLRAVVTHYGRHENGHYICYRQHPALDMIDGDEGKVPLRWWRLSDEDVSSVTEEETLDQGGVFMLFYEREPDYTGSSEITDGVLEAISPAIPKVITLDDGLTPPSSTEPPIMVPSSSQSAASESDIDMEPDNAANPTSPVHVRPQAPIMRTAPPSDVRHDVSVGRSVMSV